MEGFYDSDKFIFKLDHSGHLAPLHHRELGEKSGELYSPRVTWSDVAINGVPLEETFVFEDDIARLQEEKDDSDRGRGGIMVNSRPTQSIPAVEEVEDKRWVRRLEKLYPMNFQEAKKKKKSIERFPVKPKSKKQVRDEKIYSSAVKFQEITDENLGGDGDGVLDYSIMIHRYGDYKITEELDMSSVLPSDPWLPLRYITHKEPVYTKYCPPLHWLEPEVQWEKIWSQVDTLKTGKKRDYHYYPNGIANCEEDPCIYFYDKNSDDLNYNFDWSKDFMNVPLYFGDY
jgi:hypothetical protein